MRKEGEGRWGIKEGRLENGFLAFPHCQPIPYSPFTPGFCKELRRWVNYPTIESSVDIFGPWHLAVGTLLNFGYDAPSCSRFDQLANLLDAWPAVAGCSRAETFSQLSLNKFTPPCTYCVVAL